MATIRALPVVAILLFGCAAPGRAEPPIVAAARADAASRSGLPADRIDLVSLQSVTWRNGGLGCPQPGMLYTDALVPGWRVRLRVDGQIWDYHASERGGLLLCPPGRSEEPAPVGGRD